MKRLKFLIILLALLLFGFRPAFAADSTNVVLTISETDNSVVIQGTFTFLGTGTESRFTPAINITDLDLASANFFLFGNAASGIDVDIHLHSQIGSQGSSVSAFVLGDFLEDAIVATRQTLGSATKTYSAITGAEAATDGNYIMIEGDGQTGNPTTATMTWALFIPKKALAGKNIVKGSSYPFLVSITNP